VLQNVFDAANIVSLKNSTAFCNHSEWSYRLCFTEKERFYHHKGTRLTGILIVRIIFYGSVDELEMCYIDGRYI
jgi:hypothetical protein